MMRKIFDDKDSELLYKQINDAQSYLYKELDKSITRQLLLKIAERGLLPVLSYPVRENQYISPMSYSKQYDKQINIHTPIPQLELYTDGEYLEKFDAAPMEHHILLKAFKERVEKLDR